MKHRRWEKRAYDQSVGKKRSRHSRPVSFLFEITLSQPARASRILRSLLACVMSTLSILLISAPAFAAEDIIPAVSYQNLTELFARKTYGNTKPTELLYSDSEIGDILP